MTDELVLGSEDLERLHRHFSNLMCVDSGPAAVADNGGKPKVYNFSAFVVDVEGEWLAITAGHVFDKLRQAVAAGATLSDWQIDDSMVKNHGYPAYRIALDLQKDIIFFNDDGLDYGAYILDPMARRALEASGICPVPENSWNAEDFTDFPFWTLVGSPDQFSELKHDGPSSKRHVTVHLLPLEDRPEDIDETKYYRLYANVDFASVAEWEQQFNIGGMSGGPIFGTAGPPKGAAYNYRLIGIQSGWNRRNSVALCAAQPFLRALARLVKQSK